RLFGCSALFRRTSRRSGNSTPALTRVAFAVTSNCSMLRSVAEQAATELQEKIATLTGGEITSVNQVDRTLEWLAQRGCMLPNIQKKTLCEALNRPGLSAPARQLIELRLDGAHAAVNKLTTMRAYVAADHRIRQAFRYHGA